MNEFIIRDRIHFNMKAAADQKDALATGMKTIKDAAGNPALEIVVDATHGGYVNHNFSFYTKEGMEKGFKSFNTPFPKPVLVEHDDDKAPIGRVVESEFITLQPAEGAQGEPTSKIRIKAVITDADAVQKILDGRFLTVSIAGRPKSAPTCSVCSEKVASMWGCENDHARGQVYDGKLCYYIMGELEYSEVSFVNKPADMSEKHAAILVGLRAVEAPRLSDADEKMLADAIAAVRKTKADPVAAVAADAEEETPAPAAAPVIAPETPAPVAPVAPVVPAAPETPAPAATENETAITALKADHAAALKTLQDNIEALTVQLAAAATTATAQETALNEAKAALAKADARHANDLADQASLTQKIRDAQVRNVLALSILAGKDSHLNTFSGTNAEERAASYQKKLSEFKDISMEELTKREEALLKELTQQTILRSDIGNTGPLDDAKVAEEMKSRLSRKQRIRGWFNEGL